MAPLQPRSMLIPSLSAVVAIPSPPALQSRGLSSPKRPSVPGSGSFPKSAPHEESRRLNVWCEVRRIHLRSGAPRSLSLPSWQGRRPALPPRQPYPSILTPAFFRFPFKACAVGPDAAGSLQSCPTVTFCLFCADPLHQPNAPYLQG
jgi:hypothetical protein